MFFLVTYRTYLYGRCHMYLTKSFYVVMSDLYLADFVPRGDLCVLYCAPGVELIIIGKIFAKLCCAQTCLKQMT